MKSKRAQKYGTVFSSFLFSNRRSVVEGQIVIVSSSSIGPSCAVVGSTSQQPSVYQVSRRWGRELWLLGGHLCSTPDDVGIFCWFRITMNFKLARWDLLKAGWDLHGCYQGMYGRSPSSFYKPEKKIPNLKSHHVCVFRIVSRPRHHVVFFWMEWKIFFCIFHVVVYSRDIIS